jgi:hypothetical protein
VSVSVSAIGVGVGVGWVGLGWVGLATPFGWGSSFAAHVPRQAGVN